MKRNSLKKHIQSFNLPLIRILFVLGILSTMISCEAEDDIPPESAYVEPEPVEGCVFQVIVPELTEGIDFECGAPEFTTFGEKDGSITIEPADNPDKEGINTSDKVIMVTQTAGVEGWAGFVFDLASKVDFSEKQTIKIKVYSPAVGQNILLKLEDSADGSINKEVTMPTTVAGEWEELSFAFSPSDSDKFDKMVLFFDFSGEKDATTVHYFDDIVLTAGGGGTVASTTSFPVNFETAANGGAAENWLVFENVDNPPLEIINNPDMTGNTSATVAQFTARKDGQSFAGTITQLTTPFTLNASNSTVTMMVWKSVISDVGIKFENGAGGSTGEIKVANTKTNEWEELTFNFSGVVGDPNNTGITGLVVFPDFNDSRTQDNVVYFDNITLSGGGTSGGTNPTASAPTPTLDAANVISLFSDAYTDVPVDTWRTDWSAATLEDIFIDGNAVKKYSELNFVGIETVGNQIDASEMEFFHTDVWTADATEIRIKLVDFGADGAFDGGDDVEHEITIANPQQNSWVSLDIPLSDFPGLTTKANIAQLIFAGQPAGSATIFIDNVYFYKDTAAATEPQSAAPTPTPVATDVISLFSDAYTDVPVDTWRTDWSAATLEDISIVGNAVKKYSELNFVGIETVGNQIDASEMQFFHTDVWTADATEIRIKLVDFGANGAFDGGGDDVEHEITITNPEKNTWISLNIPLSDFTGLTTRANISQLIYAAQPAGSVTIFIDNVYFSK